MLRRIVLFLIVLVPLAGCGDCGEDPVADRDTSNVTNSDGGADGDGMTVTDGAMDGVTDNDGEEGDSSSQPDGMDSTSGDVPIDGDGGGNITCSGNLKACGGSCVDVQTSQNHCGSCGNACSGAGICQSGTCECPRYHEKCGGKCVPTHTDGDNCGSCGNQCTGDEVCSGGTCSAECLPGRSKCGNTCVDLDTDNQNCGMCGRSCPSGKGCLKGTCVDAVPVGSAPKKCQGGGPQINVGISTSTNRCLGNVAKNTFKWALCSCEDITQKNKFYTDAFDSALGRYQRGGYGGSVGTNGQFDVENLTEIYGALWASGSSGMRSEKKIQIKQQLHSGGDTFFGLTSTVDGHAYVEGDVTGMGPVTFGKTLYQNPGATAINRASWKNRVRRKVDVKPACDRCDQSRRVPVKQIVNAHKGSNNDNNLINLKANALDQPGKQTVLKLPCGEYYLSNIDVAYKTTIIAEGRTALYIGGDVKTTSQFTIKPTANGELDVFIAGDANVENEPRVGSPAYPASTRFYVGGQGGWTMGNQAVVGAYVYAIPGGFNGQNNPEIFGGVYAQNFRSMNGAEIHYDRGVLDAGKYCPPPPTGNPGDGGMMDGGTPSDTTTPSDSSTPTDTSNPTMDTSDGGGGTTPMCADSGEACQADGDCCAPMVCSNGQCDVISCVPLYKECTSDSDCCSSNCAPNGSTGLCVSG